MVEVIWPLSVAPPSCRPNTSGVLSLRRYIEETLRRSKTSYSTLQVALYYLILIMPYVPKCNFTKVQSSDSPCMRSLQCGRRMFLAALILASKYLQDRNYSTKAWSKMSGLKPAEINMNERAFLHCVNWKLHIPDHIFKRWTDIVLRFTPSQSPQSASLAALLGDAKPTWRHVIPMLTPELDIELAPSEGAFTMIPESIALQTPFASLPSFLEPEPEVVPPTPAFTGAVASLPTPRSTPPRSYIPAVGVASVDSWSVVSRAPLSRQPSIASYDSGSSRGSSPESAFSDVTRLSRSSSVSSVSTSATSISSQASVATEVCLTRLAVCGNSKMQHQVASQQTVVHVTGDAANYNPLYRFYKENQSFPAEDAKPLPASRTAKRTFSEREDVEGSSLQDNVRTLREQHRGSMPSLLREDNCQVRPMCGLQYNVQQMLGTTASSQGLAVKKRRCMSVSIAAH